MSFQRLSEGVEVKSRPPYSPGGRSFRSRGPAAEKLLSPSLLLCSRHEQLPHVTGVGPQWATTNVRQKATVVCEVRGSRSNKRLMYEPLHVIWPWPCSSDRVYNCGRGVGLPHKHKSTMAALRYVVHFRFYGRRHVCT